MELNEALKAIWHARWLDWAGLEQVGELRHGAER
jgi:hypothetical protein